MTYSIAFLREQGPPACGKPDKKSVVLNSMSDNVEYPLERTAKFSRYISDYICKKQSGP